MQRAGKTSGRARGGSPCASERLFGEVCGREPPRAAVGGDLRTLLDAFGFDGLSESGRYEFTPTGVEALPDLPEYEQSTRDAEAMDELIQLTSRLRRSPFQDEAPPHGPGLVFGPYRLLEKVAIGGMAEIFRAKRVGVEGFEKTVALKRILPHLSDNREFVTMFVDEAKTVARLAHPNIVHIFDLGRIHASYYIAMEYVHGRDLRSILRRCQERGTRIPQELALRIASRVCAGLAYAHRKRDERGKPMRIVHRDVSPQNVMISFDGDVKLTDFGIAKAAHKASVTERGTLRGKLTYMSPEQTWSGSIDHRSDIFSLGVVLYELLTDEKPFAARDKSDAKLLEIVRACRIVEPSQLRPGIPRAVEEIVMRALKREPDERYHDAEIMKADLDALLEPSGKSTNDELSRFMARIFTPAERGERPGEEATTPSRRFEPLSRPGEGASGLPLEALSIDQLLQRFRSGD